MMNYNHKKQLNMHVLIFSMKYEADSAPLS